MSDRLKVFSSQQVPQPSTSEAAKSDSERSSLDEAVYGCACGTPDASVNWICCDNDDCPVRWYHWECAGVTEEPSGDWLCSMCGLRSTKGAELGKACLQLRERLMLPTAGGRRLVRLSRWRGRQGRERSEGPQSKQLRGKKGRGKSQKRKNRTRRTARRQLYLKISTNTWSQSLAYRNEHPRMPSARQFPLPTSLLKQRTRPHQHSAPRPRTLRRVGYRIQARTARSQSPCAVPARYLRCLLRAGRPWSSTRRSKDGRPLSRQWLPTAAAPWTTGPTARTRGARSRSLRFGARFRAFSERGCWS